MEHKSDPRIAFIADIHGHAKGEHKAFAEERPIPYTARMLFLWFFHACRRSSPRFLMVADHMNYLTFEDPAAVNLVRRALKLAQAGDLYGAAETAGVELGHAAVVSEGLKRGMRYSIGAEIDNDPRCRPDAQNIVDAMKPDGMIRSIHFLPIAHPQHGDNWMWAFDNPEFRDLYDVVGTAHVWELYMTTLLDAIEKLPGTIVGHFYVPAKFGHWPEDETLEGYEDRFVAACAERGMAIELNSRYFYKYYLDDEAQQTRYKTVYARLLRKAKAANVMIAVGSDAHSPKDQGHAFETVLEMLDEAEINEIAFPIAGRLARVALRATDEAVRQQSAAPAPAVAVVAAPTASPAQPTETVVDDADAISSDDAAPVPDRAAAVPDVAASEPDVTAEPDGTAAGRSAPSAAAPVKPSRSRAKARVRRESADAAAEPLADPASDASVPQDAPLLASPEVAEPPALSAPGPEVPDAAGEPASDRAPIDATEPHGEVVTTGASAPQAARSEHPAKPERPETGVVDALADVARSVATRAVEAVAGTLHARSDAPARTARKSAPKPAAKKAATLARPATTKAATKAGSRKRAAPAATKTTRAKTTAKAASTTAKSASKAAKSKTPAKRAAPAAKKPAKNAKRPTQAAAAAKAPPKATAKKTAAKKTAAKSASKTAAKKTVAKKKSRARR